MSGSTTSYDVKLRFLLEDRAGPGAEHLARKLGDAGHAAEGLSHVLRHLTTIAGGYLGVRGLYEHFVKFNEEVQNAKISLTAMIEGGFGVPFDHARAQADGLYNSFQQFSTQLPVMTQNLLEFSRGVAVSVQQAGGSIKDIKTITEMGAAGAQTYGFDPAYAAREISELLAGNANNRMLFVKQLAGMGHKTIDELRKMTGSQRLDFLKTTLTSPAMADAIKAMSSSFAGVTSTLKDKLWIQLGKVGLPLFKAITAEVAHWNDWLNKNQAKVDQLTRTVGTDLVEAFRVVNNVFAFVYNHADTLIKIGEVWAAVKVGGLLGSGLSGLVSSGANALSMLGSPLGAAKAAEAGAEAGLSVVQALPLAGKALAAGVALGHLADNALHLSDMLSHSQNVNGERLDMSDPTTAKYAQMRRSEDAMDKDLDIARQQLANVKGAGGTMAAAGLLQQEIFSKQKANLVQDMIRRGDFNWQVHGTDAVARHDLKASGYFTDAETNAIIKDPATQEALFSITSGTYRSRRKDAAGAADAAWSSLPDAIKKSVDRQAVSQALMAKELQTMSTFISGRFAPAVLLNAKAVDDVLSMFIDHNVAMAGRGRASAQRGTTIHHHYHHQRIEVQSNDPDRFAFGLMKAFHSAAKNPSQALDALREG